jgi:hypothetical protein
VSTIDLSSHERLKLALLADGIRVDPAAGRAWRDRFSGPLTLGEYATTSGIALRLPGDLYVNAPLVDHADTPVLGFDGDHFVVTQEGGAIEVGVIPVPAYHQQTQVDRLDGSVHPYTHYGVTHTDRCRVSPIAGCAWKCHFCDLPYEFTYRKRHQDNLLEVIRAAERDPLSPARHVLISGGTPRAPITAREGRPGRDDERWLDEVYAHLARHSPIPVDVMMPPRRDLGHPQWLREAGINMVSINLEVSDPERAKAIAPAKSRVGREHTLAYIEAAVRAFEVGFVQSLVVFGRAIEPLESTLRGVQDLVDRGCIPVLSPFRPHRLTPLADAPAATLDEIVTVFLETREICRRAGNRVRPGPRCVACHHNTVALPDGSSFYVGQSDDLIDRACTAC